jgi:hypothetical protein
MDLIKNATATVALLSLLGGTVYSAALALDNKYVPMSEWKSFKWSQLKKDLREIEKGIAEAEFAGNEPYAERLEEEYEELLEFLCREYPEDREC